jgi:hypothetical protein
MPSSTSRALAGDSSVCKSAVLTLSLRDQVAGALGPVSATGLNAGKARAGVRSWAQSATSCNMGKAAVRSGMHGAMARFRMSLSNRGANAADKPGEGGSSGAAVTAKGSAYSRALRTLALLGSAFTLASGCSSLKGDAADSGPDAERSREETDAGASEPMDPSDAAAASDALGPIDATDPRDAAPANDALLSDGASAELDAAQADAASAATDGGLPVSFSEVHAILMAKCVPCHTADGGSGYAAFVDGYAAVLNASKLCAGDVVGTCIGLAVKNEIPEGQRCRTAVVRPFHREGWQCLSADERAAIQAWVDAGLQGP